MSSKEQSPHRIPERAKILHRLYVVGLWLKGVDGILEVLGGVLFLAVPAATLARIVAVLTQHELSEDPSDWVANHVRAFAGSFLGETKPLAGFYLLGHGGIKIILVWGGLLKGRTWAFPTALGVLGAFILYQSYRIVHRFSMVLLVLTIVDALVWLLIGREYGRMKSSRSGDSDGKTTP